MPIWTKKTNSMQYFDKFQYFQRKFHGMIVTVFAISFANILLIRPLSTTINKWYQTCHQYLVINSTVTQNDFKSAAYFTILFDLHLLLSFYASPSWWHQILFSSLKTMFLWNRLTFDAVQIQNFNNVEWNMQTWPALVDKTSESPPRKVW